MIASAALAVLCLAPPVLAAGAQGTSAFQFLQLGVGARPSGMGEVFTGVADDVNSVYWNPAGLAALERPELSMTHALWLQDISYSNLAYGQPALGGTLGLAFNVLSSGNIQKADNTGLRLADSYSMRDMMGLVSYSHAWGALALGGNLKYITSKIEQEKARSFAADLGALYTGLRPWGRRLKVGLAVQNMGTRAKYVAEEFPLPLTIRAGGSLALFEGLLVASDLAFKEGSVRTHIGTEYLRPAGAFVLAARAGYKDDTPELGALSGLTLGAGIRWSNYQLDYAWNSFGEIGLTHRMTLGIRFSARKAAPVSVRKPPEAPPIAPPIAPIAVAAAPPAAPQGMTPAVVAAVLAAAGDPACDGVREDQLCMKLEVEFDSAKADLKGTYASQLHKIALFISANAGTRIELAGYTDDQGADAYNLKLSRNRARAVMKHFIEVDGLDAGRLSVKGLGEARPFASNLTEKGRQTNRRVIAILSMGD